MELISMHCDMQPPWMAASPELGWDLPTEVTTTDNDSIFKGCWESTLPTLDILAGHKT
jgi:hypothetical protein